MQKTVHRRRADKQMVNDADSRYVPVAYTDTVQADDRRMHLLLLTRRADPLSAVFDVRHIAYTALPRVLTSINMLFIVAAYASTAVTTRRGYWVYDDSSDTATSDGSAVEGMELLVTFNLVFYFGYCYNRFWQQQELAMQCKNSISVACSLVRASGMSEEEVHNMWRWLNLAHIAGYVGLSPVYTRVNLLEGVAKAHTLMARRSYELQRVNELDLDAGTGPIAYGEFMVWALRLLDQAAARGTIHNATLENCQQAILSMRQGMTGLFDLQTHVIPFCYVHLAALLTNSYLIVIAISKGRLCAPDASWSRGLVFPLLALSFLAISCLCLIEIGGRMQNPLGADEEDLPVHLLIERTLNTSKAILDVKLPPSLRPAGSPATAVAAPESSVEASFARPKAEPSFGGGTTLDQQLSQRRNTGKAKKVVRTDPLAPASVRNEFTDPPRVSRSFLQASLGSRNSKVTKRSAFDGGERPEAVDETDGEGDAENGRESPEPVSV